MIHSMHTGDHAVRPDLSIVVPVYRSEDCLEALIEAVAKALNPTNRDYEVVLVNDCSPDKSWAVIESICRTNSNVVGVDLRRNFGQDNAIITGLRQARGRFVAIMDDDLQHHPRDLPALLHKIEEGDDAVYADFGVKQQKWWKNLGSWFNGKFAEWVQRLGQWVVEITLPDANVKGFQVLPRRWVVERTFSWFSHSRRLSKDYEYYPQTSEAMIYVVMIRLMLRRLNLF